MKTAELESATTGYSLGAILHVKSRGVLGNKSFAALNTHKGWQRVNDYNVIGKAREVKGVVGPSIDIDNMKIISQLHAGVVAGGRVENILHLAALPPGATVIDPSGRVFTKADDDRFHLPDGRSADYHYFSPRDVTYTVQLPKEEE